MFGVYPDGLTLASGSEDKTIRIWNRYSGNEIRTLAGHAEAVRALALQQNYARQRRR